MWESIFTTFESRTNEVWHLFVDWAAEHLLQILIIVIGAEILYRVSTKTINRVVHHATHRPDLFPTEVDRRKRVKTLDSLVNATLRVVIFIIATIMVINELGVNTGPLIASAGVIGVALGFGAQSLIKDFMSGFFIITENQYRVGDVIEIATMVGNVKVTGTVEAITIRTTVLRDLSGQLHHIPNGNIIVTTNMTMNYASLNEEIMLDKDTDIDKLEHVINHTGEELANSPDYKRTIIEPPHFERVETIAGEGVVVKILGKTIPGEQWKLKGVFYRRLLKAFDKNHIKLAHAQTIVHKGK